MLYIISMLGLSKRFFRQERKEDLKEGMKFVAKLYSLLMACFLFLFQIPMITIYLQSYLCDEDPNESYTLVGMKCYSMAHQLLITFSTLSLIIYLIFLFVQSLLFTSNNFESSLPWSSLERRLAIARILLKLLLAAAFVFDKEGKIRGPIDLVCFLLSLFVVYNRYHKALIFNQSVFYAMIIYEVQQMWLFLCVSIHVLSSNPFNILSLVFLMVSGFFISFIIIMLQIRKKQIVIQSDPYKFTNPTDNEIYLYRIYQLILSNDKSDLIMMHGILCNHMC